MAALARSESATMPWSIRFIETRAWTNFEVIEVLHQREEREWVRFGRIRQR
jgi:hypothetical protein